MKDIQTGAVTRVSVNSEGTQTNAGSHDPSISSDGQYVAFESYATNLHPNDPTTDLDVYRWYSASVTVTVDTFGYYQPNGRK